MAQVKNLELKEVLAKIAENMSRASLLQNVKPFDFKAKREYLDCLNEQKALIALRGKMIENGQFSALG